MGNISETIQIDVNAMYMEEKSAPTKNHFVFAYSIEITNNGSETVKLLNRHWFITDDNNMVEEVIGEGVIGRKPKIKPGESFSYTSGAIIETEFGTMHGSYEMETTNGEKFTATIPAFLLAMPHKVH